MPAFLTDALQNKTKTLKCSFDKNNPFSLRKISEEWQKKNNKKFLLLKEHK